MALRAYKSMLSLLQLVENIKLQSRYGRLSVDGQQVKDLTAAIDYLLNFLEGLPPRLSPELEEIAGKIDDMAFKARNAIDVRAVDQLRGAHRGEIDGGLSWFCRDLGMIFHDIVLIEVEIAMVVSELAPLVTYQQPLDSNYSTPKNLVTNVVGFDGHILRLKDELLDNQKTRRIIPVVGMGGCGKSTLAGHVFEDAALKRHFDRCFWITVSREYILRKLLRSVLDELHVDAETEEIRDLGTLVYQNLRGYRYFIVLDDVWSRSAWDDLKLYFPDEGNKSRIIVTTRDTYVAAQICSTPPLLIRFLGPDEGWELLRQRVFEDKICPPELEEIGKDITRNCKGLPLSIVTIAGLLLSSDMTIEYWNSVSANVLSALLNSKNDKHCMNVLLMSYESLPIYLRLCFLQMGGYAEDAYLYFESLIAELVTEALIRPKPSKTHHEVASGCLNELVGRNLLFIREVGGAGEVKKLGIHDLLLELCRTKSQNEELHVRSLGSYDEISSTEREFYSLSEEETDASYASICMRCSCFLQGSRQIGARCFGSIFHQIRCLQFRAEMCSECRDTPFELGLKETQVHIAKLLCSPPSRSIHDCKYEFPHFHALNREIPILPVEGGGFLRIKSQVKFTLPLVFLWNLQEYWTPDHGCKYVKTVKSFLGHGTLSMPQLVRADDIGLHFFFVSSPLIQQYMILEQLDFLAINGFFEGMALVVPNLRFLIIYARCVGCDGVLEKLIKAKVEPGKFDSIFPSSLRILKLNDCNVGCEQMEAIAKLPNLGILKVRRCRFEKDGRWVLVEGGFRCLKYLKIARTPFKLWRARAMHFPLLRALEIEDELEIETETETPFNEERIHPDLGNIETLHSLKLINCCGEVDGSAKKILKQQYRLGNESLCIEIDRQVVTVDEDELDEGEEDAEDDEDVVEDGDAYENL